jgi:uncharacterized damage-inducible protein DinB
MASGKRVRTLTDKLAATRGEILQTIEGLDEKALTWQPGDGRWSIKETLAHLASAEGSHRQVAQAIAVGQTVDVPDFDLDAWNAVQVAERRQRSIDEVLKEMATERQRTLDALQNLEDEALDRQGPHPALGETTVLKIFRIIPIHERWHLKDIKKLLEEQGEQRVHGTVFTIL